MLLPQCRFAIYPVWIGISLIAGFPDSHTVALRLLAFKDAAAIRTNRTLKSLLRFLDPRPTSSLCLGHFFPGGRAESPSNWRG